jgi:hypothetical protein
MNHDPRPLPDIPFFLTLFNIRRKNFLLRPPQQVHKIYHASRFFIAFFYFFPSFSHSLSVCLSVCLSLWFAAARNYSPTLYPTPPLVSFFPRGKLFGSPSAYSIDFCVRAPDFPFVQGGLCTSYFF